MYVHSHTLICQSVCLSLCPIFLSFIPDSFISGGSRGSSESAQMEDWRYLCDGTLGYQLILSIYLFSHLSVSVRVCASTSINQSIYLSINHLFNQVTNQIFLLQALIRKITNFDDNQSAKRIKYQSRQASLVISDMGGIGIERSPGLRIYLSDLRSVIQYFFFFVIQYQYCKK